jgi:DNA polymerase-3 subunit gamma/tau
MVLVALPDSAGSGLIDKPKEQIDDMVSQTKLFTKAQLSRVANLVSDGISQLRGAAAPRLQLELLMARLVTIEVTEDLAERVKKLEFGGAATNVRPSAMRAASAQEQQSVPPSPAPTTAAAPTQTTPTQATTTHASASEVPAPEATASTPPSAPAPVATTAPVASTPPARPTSSTPPPRKPSQVRGNTVEEPKAPETEAVSTTPASASIEPTVAQVTGNVTLENLRNSWPMVMEALKEKGRVAWMMLAESTPLSIDGNILTIAMKDAGAVKNFTGSSHPQLLQLVLQEVMKIDVRIQAAYDPNTSAPSKKTIADASGMADASPDDAVSKTADAVSLLTALGGTVTSETPRES